MSRKQKAEVTFWMVILFAVGVIIGAVAYAVLCPPRESKRSCSENGKSVQVEGTKRITSYIPALDKCDKEK